MVGLIFWGVRGTENRSLRSLELFVHPQPVVLLQEREVLWNRNEASSRLSMWAHFRVTCTEGTLSVRSRTQALPSGHLHSNPRLPRCTQSLNIPIQFLYF